MTQDENEAKRSEELKRRRMRLAEVKKNKEKREKYGPAVVSSLNASLGTHLSLSDFEPDRVPSVNFEWAKSLEDSIGLKAVHTSKPKVLDILRCCTQTIGNPPGVLWFGDQSYLGTVELLAVDLSKLVDLAEHLHDSVLFSPHNYKAVFLVDYYPVRGTPRPVDFSLVVQGQALEAKLAECFSNVLLLRRADG